MRNARFRFVLVALAALALVLPWSDEVPAQSKGTIKIATQSPLSGGQAASAKASSSAPSSRWTS